MATVITRRSWLKGTTSIAAGLVFAGEALGQSLTTEGYKPSKENPIRFNSNENPYGVSAVAKKAMNEAYDKSHLYSRPGRDDLKKLISKMENVPFENILVSSGSKQLLQVMGLITALEGGKVLAPSPTYLDLTRYSESLGVETIWVPVDDELSIDLDALREAYTDDVKLIYICNPNNPIPSVVNGNALKEFCLEMSKKCYVFVDEAYHEYVIDPNYSSMIDLAIKHDNIFVSRTASKIHGFAGVRVGFGFGTVPMLEKIKARLTTGAVPTPAIYGAIASYKDQKTIDYVLQKNKESLDIIYDLFDKHNVRYIKSNANFTFYETGIEIEEVIERFLKYGIKVGRAFPPYRTWCRLSTSTPEDTKYFAEVFEKEFV